MRCLIPSEFLVRKSQRFAVSQCVVWYQRGFGTGKSTFYNILNMFFFFSFWAFWYRKVKVLKYINALFIPIGHSGTVESTFCSISMRCLFPLGGVLVQESQGFEVFQCVVCPFLFSGTRKSTFWSISMRYLIPSGFLVQENQRFTVYQCVVWTHWGFWHRKVNVIHYLNALCVLIGVSGTGWGKSTFWIISMRCLVPTGFLVQESQRFTITICCLFPLGILVQGSQCFAVHQCVVYSHWSFWYRKVNVLQYLNALFDTIGVSDTGKSTFYSISMRCLIPLGFLAQESQRYTPSQCIVCFHWGFWYRIVNVLEYINVLFDTIGVSGTEKSTF